MDQPHDSKKMKKIKMYSVKPEWLYGDDQEHKRAKQLAALESLGLKETSMNVVVCNAEQVIDLIKSGYCGEYRQTENIEELGEFDAGPDVEDLFQIMADKVAQLAPASFNEKCHQHQPNSALFSVAETMLMENSCTDALQEKLAEGWRIIAVQPQPDQRRPDYILGRPLMSAVRA